MQLGITFEAIVAGSRTAVDPLFLFDPVNDANKTYHRATSDAFFAHNEKKFDVIYLDGLHTFEQTLRDFINAASFLAEDGYILIDDVRPSSFSASLRDFGHSKRVKKVLNDQSGLWMGDVFRLIYFIDSFFQQFSFQLVSRDHSQCVVWREQRGSLPERRVKEICEKGFRDVKGEFGELFSVVEFEEWYATSRK